MKVKAERFEQSDGGGQPRYMVNPMKHDVLRAYGNHWLSSLYRWGHKDNDWVKARRLAILEI